MSAALHYYHGAQHDLLWLDALENHSTTDSEFNKEIVDFLGEREAHTEPTMDLYAPVTARKAWKIFRAIDWTHIHHEQTYDIMSDSAIDWAKKKQWTDRAVKYYLKENPVARSTAPLEVTMRRAAVMMKPYFTYYRNYYPRSAEFAYVAHWWHPVIYEAMMISGNGKQQEATIAAVNKLMAETVLKQRPKRMLLSREIMPRYSRMSPESANIFDNLHMLHGIIYDILAYEGWSDDEKQAELYRVVDAMSYQEGDEKYARRFPIPVTDVDPRAYPEWMARHAGEMNRIMHEMMQEMMPMMMPEPMTAAAEEMMWEQFRRKTTPDMEEGEFPGSLMDALKKEMPAMRMSAESMAPGKTDEKMVNMMLGAWEHKFAAIPAVEPWPMATKQAADPKAEVE